MTIDQCVQVICPALYTLSGYSTYIAMASGMTNIGFFGDQWYMATALLAAHYYVLDTKRAGAAGVETYKMEGRLALSYGGVGVIRDPLELSAYGMQYKAIRQSRTAGVTISDSTIQETYAGGYT